MSSSEQPADSVQHLYERLDIGFALKATGIGVWELDGATGLVNWDNECRNLFGFDRDNQVPYEAAAGCIHRDDVPWVDKAIEATLTRQATADYNVTYRIIRANDSTLRWIHSQGKAYFQPTGELIRFIGINQDVTGTVLARQAVEESEARYRQLAEDLELQVQERTAALRAANKELTAINGELLATNERERLARQQLEMTSAGLQNAIELAELGNWSVDIATNVLTASPRVVNWFGFDSLTADVEAYIGGVGEPDRDQVRASLYNTLQPDSDGRYDVIHSVVNARTGYRRILHALGRVFFDAAGQPIKIEGIAHDVTAERELQLLLEQQVHHRTEELATSNEELAATNEELLATNENFVASNQKLELTINDLTRSNDNLQQFAYIASHDLQEPLRKIRSFGDVLKNQYREGLGDGVDLLERMQAAADRMSILIRDLLSYSRIATRQDTSRPISLEKVVATTLGDLEVAIDEAAAQITVGPLPTVQGDAVQLGQLFQNLLGNALKFRRADTPSRIQVSAQQISAAELPDGIRPARLADVYHRIDVADNGIGFDEKYVDRIFQVFQRLHGKQAYVGTGVGLAIVEKVSINHGGAVTATSTPGQGATFTVYLPAA